MMKDLLKIIQQQSATIDSLTNELALLREVEREEITYKRKKAKGKRQALLAQFDSEEVHHRLEDCICPDCQ
ncbi:hypothetical protein E3V59_01670, partial [Streptococcus pseudopneumoniae]